MLIRSEYWREEIAKSLDALEYHLGGQIRGVNLASIQFFLVTNFGAWVTDIHSATPLYTSDWKGLLECYTLGVAFFRTEAWPFGFFGKSSRAKPCTSAWSVAVSTLICLAANDTAKFAA